MTTLPLAPLTHDELNRRSSEERIECGYRCVTVSRFGGKFEQRDLDFLLEHAALADAYLEAALVRCQR